jgi:hypothetical protein
VVLVDYGALAAAFRADLARTGAAKNVKALLDEVRRPDLGMVIYNPATPADADRVSSLINIG